MESIDEGGSSFTDRQSRRIRRLWHSTGAAVQYDEEGRLTPRVQTVGYAQHVGESSVEWLRVRLARRILDGWRCHICGRDDVPLEAHHALGYGALDEGRQGTIDEVKDCRSLCGRCHAMVEAKRK